MKTEPGLEWTDCESMTDPNSGTRGSGRKMESATARQTHASGKRGDPGPGGDSSVPGGGKSEAECGTRRSHAGRWVSVSIKKDHWC